MGWQSMDSAPKGKIVTVTDGTIVAVAICNRGNTWWFWEGEITDAHDQDYGVLNYWLKGFGPTRWWDFGDGQTMPPTGDT